MLLFKYCIDHILIFSTSMVLVMCTFIGLFLASPNLTIYTISSILISYLLVTVLSNKKTSKISKITANTLKKLNQNFTDIYNMKTEIFNRNKSNIWQKNIKKTYFPLINSYITEGQISMLPRIIVLIQ